MSHEILINVTPQETRVAMLEQGVVQELHMERASSRGLVGNICLGRVARVLPGMQSAFVEIGLERAAFLHIADIWEHRQYGHGGTDQRPIEKILHEGQALLVQVIKDPIGTKGARLSTQVSLAGRLLVYLPQDSHIGISQRIEDEAERESLREKLQQQLPEGLAGGFIIRTMAEAATEREMANDIEYLTKLWNDLNTSTREVPAPALLYQDLSLAQRVLRDMTVEERKIFQAIIDEYYGDFLNAVATNRKDRIPAAELRTIADGRVYTARQALELKLIDGIGYFDDAFKKTLDMAGLKAARLVSYTYYPGSKTNIYASQLGEFSPLDMKVLESYLAILKTGFYYLWLPQTQ